MTQEETLYTIALTLVPNVGLMTQRLLLDEMGSSCAIYEHRKDIGDVPPLAQPRLREALAKMDTCLKRAEEEMRFVEEGRIQCLGLHDEAYPQRLVQCPDAPILLFYRGSASLNTCHIISMVGTRQITEYGKDLCKQFVGDLKRLLPDALIVSGLAYGVDVHCHRAAIEQEMETVGVLAHGLDQIYPRLHRNTAIEMVKHGGLLTEFMSKTRMDKRFFVQRNRIVAGISDATIVVESALKGGSLITAEIANGYNRDVYTFPGRVQDTYSAGCNQLIQANRAALITSAEDFVRLNGWENEAQQQQQLKEGIQQELFPDLSPEEQRIVEALRGSDGKQINILTVQTGIPVGKLTSLLFTLEMNGIVRMLSGGMYRLVANRS